MFDAANETCRLCLGKDPSLSYSLLADHEDIADFKLSLSIESDFADKTLHPAHICDQCNLVMMRFLKLKRKAKESEKILSKYSNCPRIEMLNNLESKKNIFSGDNFENKSDNDVDSEVTVYEGNIYLS